MKILLGLATLFLGIASLFAYNGTQQGKLQTQQLDDYDRQVSRLLSQIENNSRQRLETEKQIQDLTNQLNNNDKQISALVRELDIAQKQINPDYEQLEARIRQQLSREIQQADTRNRDSRVTLIKQLSALGAEETGEIFALHGQYGAFLQSLNVSNERMEVIIAALGNMLAAQNQARRQLLQTMQSAPQNANGEDLLRQMMEPSNPEAQLEILAYDLTESELDAFAEFQRQRQDTAISIISGAAFSGGDDPVFFGGNVVPSGAGEAAAIRILQLNPDN